ncbi:MAG: DUF1501 domain-containing protein [Pseudomonadota bacterium]
MTTSRRTFLKNAGAAAISASSFGLGPASFTAHAADTSGYKALVCVFLFGGLDNHDFILPYDQSSYDTFATIRQTLLTTQGTSRDRSSLLALNPLNASDFGSRQFALPPEMPLLKGLFDSGDMALVGNVGPLIEPVTRTTFESGAAKLPPRLFSHNDQQATWQSSEPEGAQFGWGGLFADAILASGGNAAAPEFTTISSTEVGPFLTGNTAQPYQVSTEGSAQITLLEGLDDGSLTGTEATFFSNVKDRFRAQGFNGTNILEQDMATKFRNGIDSNDQYDAARAALSPLATTFPRTNLGEQLKSVAETIAIRGALSASRQLFFVGTGGFDTHSAQARTLPRLLGNLDSALAAFNSAMAELGLSNDVTLFTASDFGRTLAVNGDGTDHGWGGHQLVMGGAVSGNRIYGSLPEPVLDTEQDTGGGRWIPSLAVEQYADPIGRWWGLTAGEVSAALPNLGNFNDAGLTLFS